MGVISNRSTIHLDSFARELRSTADLLRRIAVVRIDSELLEDVADILVDGARGRMIRAETPDGQPHEPLSKPHLKWKKARGYSSRIWFATGEAHRSVRSKIRGKSVIQLRIGGAGGNSKVIHDGGYSEADGASGGPYLVPPRPVLGVSEDDRAHIVQAVGRWVERLFTRGISGSALFHRNRRIGLARKGR